MNWLTPLGFLGFIGLLILFLIYILKPNYQNKSVSTTYVWKLSLKYRKKKIPISKLRNILLIICQVLIVCACAFMLAQPFIDGEDKTSANEKVIIIDASGSMQAEVAGETRFERAITQAETLIKETFAKDSVVSVILAGREAKFIYQRATADMQEALLRDLKALADPNDFQCTYGAADIDGSMVLAESVLEANAKAGVVLFTGTTYIDDGKVDVRYVSDPNEKNVSIANVRAGLEDNLYRIEVDMVSYGENYSGILNVQIKGAKGTYGLGDSAQSYNGETLNFSCPVDLIENERTKFRFGAKETYKINELQIYAYDSIYCYIDEKDSLTIDNAYYLYGGTPQKLKIQYYSTRNNIFVNSMLLDLQDQMREEWDIDIDTIKDSSDAILNGNGKEDQIQYTGYDIYIFEQRMPAELPTDGLVILLYPDTVPESLEITLSPERTYGGEGTAFTAGASHPIMEYVKASNIRSTKYKTIPSYDSCYTPLMYANGEPVALAKNEPDSKILILTFNFHYSNFPIIPEYPTLMLNTLNYFIPTTFDKNVYNLYDKVVLNSRSESLTVSGPAFEEALEFTTTPVEIYADAPGTYTVTQTPISGNQIVENFSVVIPEEQCDITRKVDTLVNPYFPPVIEEVDLDLVIYFAIALVALLFCEWWLKSRDN